MTEEKSAAKGRSGTDQDAERYPTFKEAMTRAGRDSSFAEERVRRVDIRFGAGGDGVYRIWIVGDEDWLAGTLAGP